MVFIIIVIFIIMQLLPIKDGGFTLINDWIYDIVRQWTWRLDVDGYPRTAISINGKRCRTHLHHFVMGKPFGLWEVDHKDHDKLNNLKSNLRWCTHRQNNYNRMAAVGGASVFKGVHWDARKNRWGVRLKMGGYRKRFGRYRTEIEAALAYDAAAKEYHGGFAYLNFPEGVTNAL